MDGTRLIPKICPYQNCPAHVDGNVGDIEDGEPLEVDEVDHLTTQQGLSAKQSVGDIAQGSTDNQTYSDIGSPIVLSPDRDHKSDDDHHCEHTDYRTPTSPLPEGHTPVERKVELQCPDDVIDVPISEVIQGPLLAQLIDNDDERSCKHGQPTS